LAIVQTRILVLDSRNHKHSKDLEMARTNRRASCY
jgi:hypothetical protein